MANFRAYPTVATTPSRKQRKYLSARIVDIDRALTLLEKNPEMEELTDLLRRL